MKIIISMISFAAITPHPPIILPEIGKQDVVYAEKTINALLSLGLAFAKSAPDIVLIISPHAAILHDRIAIGYEAVAQGDFASFGHPEIQMRYPGHKDFTDRIVRESIAEKIPMEPYVSDGDRISLDHGAMVPLYYLSKAYNTFKLVVSSFSDFSLEKHFKYGKAIKRAIDGIDQKVAVIASGDLSHRLKEDGPYGFHPSGPLFDKTLVDLLQNKNEKKILHLPPAFVDEAGECGYRSIAILLGILHDTSYSPHILSYEGPWGVGYLVANMVLG